MKRKLISFEAFKNLQENSISKIEEELILAEDLLGKTLGVDVELHCFGENDATYKTSDDNYIHAIYKLEDDKVIFEKIQELVIDEETSKKAARKAISEMVDAIIEGKDEHADDKFDEYFSMPSVRRQINEAMKFKVSVSKPTGKRSKLFHKKQSRSLVAKRVRNRRMSQKKISVGKKTELARKRKTAAKKLGSSKNPRWRTYVRAVKNMKEWYNLAENVFGYVEYKTYGPMISESVVQPDANGNIVSVAIPNMQKRNEGKVLSFQWKTLDTDLKVLRGNAKTMNEDQSFVKAIAELKRYNNTSNNSALEEALENMVSKFPQVIYLTQGELTSMVAEAFEAANLKNYDDNTCDFIAEAILRTAHSAYTDRVKKIAVAAGEKGDITAECRDCKDSYKEFQQVVKKLYRNLDESEQINMQVFSDLYKALFEMHKVAIDIGDEVVKTETASMMSECEAVLSKTEEPNLELAESIAEYISDFAEANLENSGEWKDQDVHTSVGGDHPKTSWNAKQNDAVPSKFNGRDEYGVNRAPVSDGKDFGGEEEMAHNALGNDGSDHTWPSLSNPYVPDPFKFTMKGEKGVDKDEDEIGTFQSNDTWPNLQNPLHPKARVAQPVE